MMAWRVMCAFADRRVADCAPCSTSRCTSASRVPSPSAANTSAMCGPPTTACSATLDIFLHIPHLGSPAARVHEKGACTTMRRYVVEAGFRDCQVRAVCNRCQAELDQGGRFVMRIRFGIDTERNPAKTEISLRFNRLHCAKRRRRLRQVDRRWRETGLALVLPDHGLVQWTNKFAPHRGSLDTGPFKRDPEPLPELLRIGQGAPHPGNGRSEHDAFFNLV